MSEIPFVAVDAEQLGDHLGTVTRCPKCGELHEVKHSDPPALQFVRCGDSTYLVGIEGQEITK